MNIWKEFKKGDYAGYDLSCPAFRKMADFEKEFEKLKKEIEEKLNKLESKLNQIQEAVENIQSDIYISEEPESEMYLDEDLECSGHCSSCCGCSNEEN